MRRWAVRVALALLIGLPMAYCARSDCAWCPTYDCYGGDCPKGCKCITPSGSAGAGRCHSVD